MGTKNLKIILIKNKEILEVKIDKYSADYARGEGFALEVSTREGYRETVGCVISSDLAAIKRKNLSGKSSRLTEYEKVVLSVRAYCNPDFSLDENNEFLITTDNYKNLVKTGRDNSKVKEEIKRKLFIFFSNRPKYLIDATSLYCSLPYDITSIRDSLSLLEEIEDIKVANKQVEHWHTLYKLNSKIYKELEAKFGSEKQPSQDETYLVAQDKKKYDFFICHASEDKMTFVDELASTLAEEGFEIWYDDFIPRWGDSLREQIDDGLKLSKYGIVVLSKNFIRKDKKWAHRELNALFAQEQKGKKILPIWHDIDEEEIREFSPLLLDKKAMRSSDGIDKIVEEAKRLLGKNE